MLAIMLPVAICRAVSKPVCRACDRACVHRAAGSVLMNIGSCVLLCVSLQAPCRSYPSIRACTAFRKVPGTMACYYAGLSLESCDQKGQCRIWMLGKGASLEERFCCSSCSEWLQREGRVRPYTAGSVVDSPWSVLTLDASVVVCLQCVHSAGFTRCLLLCCR